MSSMVRDRAATSTPSPENMNAQTKQSGKATNAPNTEKSPNAVPMRSTANDANVAFVESQMTSAQSTSDKVIGVVAIA